MKEVRTWVLIADAGRARVLETLGSSKELNAVADLTFENELPPTHELVRDQQPRSVESVGEMRHPIAPRTDPRRKEKRRFVEELSEMLDQRLRGKGFDRLVLVAPPQVLGDLRDTISPAVRAAVVAEVPKDLTKTPNREVASHLAF
jgi:protein required for attachment to host cells